MSDEGLGEREANPITEIWEGWIEGLRRGRFGTGESGKELRMALKLV